MFYEKLQHLCRKQGISVTEFAKQIGLSQSNVTTWKAGAIPRSKTLKASSEFFNVPISYFTEDEPVNVHTVQDNHGIIGHAHAPVTINGGADQQLSEQAAELLGIFESLNVVNKARLLAYAAELKEKQ